MDRNSAIGMVLIALLLMLYFYLSPSPKQKPATKADSTLVASTENKVLRANPLVDSAAIKSYGTLGSYLMGSEEIIHLENQDLKLQFSNRAVFKNVELKNFKTYSQLPLQLIEKGNNTFALNAQYQGQNIDLYRLYYHVEQSRQSDSTIVVFAADLSADAYIKHIYSIPSKGYQIGYRLESKGVSFGGNNMALSWTDPVALQEKDLKDSRAKTTIHYYTKNDEHDYLSETSDDEKSLSEAIKWVSIKQKF
ncbi:MAG: hypothetical protein ACKO96_45290, partial [Flammeovirgaceae bacterium]